ncbi:MAG TPA: hypothetical protein DDW76_14775 [Cyanobacteria bacterium UBA11369]|nr:hypothetical protein [Cyanobacteria bacterium UBA11371]HBE17585.1 hypothetical protein [Cyanobacteria bacterium UBA11367]HBE36089.1 hypothetical protein [Cyanobacteria bacterium UBA11368]HBE50021.1 hypothetical protein [Cyanobacteria bacterium UBA11369]
MSNCPICQTEYVDGAVNFCFTCGWDLTPYPVTFTGQIPAAFLDKERAKLVWAKQTWSRILDTQYRLNQQKADISSQLTEQLTQTQQQLTKTINQHQQLQATLDQITDRVVKELLEKLRQERAEEAAQLAQYNTGISSWEQVTRERAKLAAQLEQANTKISRLKQLVTQLAQDKIGNIISGYNDDDDYDDDIDDIV